MNYALGISTVNAAIVVSKYEVGSFEYRFQFHLIGIKKACFMSLILYNSLQRQLHTPCLYIISLINEIM